MTLKMAVFGIANLAYAAEISCTTCGLCLRNPNAIALGVGGNSLTQPPFLAIVRRFCKNASVRVS
jgi:hypothetical protein